MAVPNCELGKTCKFAVNSELEIDSFKKIVIVGDDIATYTDENGFVFMGLFQFLRNEKLMK